MSKTGLSVVTVVFAEHVDTYFARQLVFERLQAAKERIPAGLASPEMGPITTGLGQIYKYIITGEGKSAMELRTINDWFVKFQLRTIPGVTDVLSFGGEVRQYQVQVDPDRLFKLDLTLAALREAIQANNTNAGGWYLEGDQEQLVVRGEGRIRGGLDGVHDLESIVLKSIDGTPIYLRDVATVAYGSEIRQGAITMNGEGEVVMGLVLQLKGANTKKTIKAVTRKIDAMQDSLPAGVKIVPIYDQADLVDQAIFTVGSALGIAGFLIILVLFLFLWDLRSSLVVLCSVPLSMLIAVIMMRHFELSANLQSLGGLAIAIGMMVDGSIVVVENTMRHLSEPANPHESKRQRVLRAAAEVGTPVFFSVLIIVVVFLPLFTLQGVEGKLFGPMAFTIAFAMLGALIVALTIVPVLSGIVLKAKTGAKTNPLMRVLERLVLPALYRWFATGAESTAPLSVR